MASQSGGRPDVVVAPGGDTSLPGRSMGGGAQGGTAGAAQGGRDGDGRSGATGRGQRSRSTSETPRDVAGTRENSSAERKPAPPDPEQVASDWRWLVGALLALGTLGLASFFVWRRTVQPAVERRRVTRSVPLDLEDDPDPRRFVVKAYQAMTSALALVGLGRKASDTPGEYVETVARRQPEVSRPVAEISGLFEVARYSDLMVTARDASRARDAWSSVASVVRRSRPASDEE
jgi:hypothetical protein